MKKTIFKILGISSSVILLAAIIFFLSAFLKADEIASPKRQAEISTPDFNGLYFDAFETESENGKIKGWFIPAQKSENEILTSNKTVIASHNYKSNREMNEADFLSLAEFLAENGYNIITFDYSGAGSSGGNKTGFGQKKELCDLEAVISYLKKEMPESEIVLYGIGFGASTALLAAENPAVSAVISDSAYADLSETLDNSISFFTNNDFGLFNSAVKALLPLVSAVDYNYQSPIDVLEGVSGKKFLFIQGNADSFLPIGATQRLYDTALKNNEAKLYLVSGAEHGMSYLEDGYDYKNTLLAFLTE